VLRVERLQVGRLAPITFEVADGACLAVEGASGAGKSLLLRALADLDDADGAVRLDGIERADMPAHEWRRRVRYCAAEPQWWTDTPRGALQGASSAVLDDLLVALDLAPALIDQPVSLLSTGERQRLALARALIDDPKVLLLDEPTGALDPISTSRVEDLVRAQLLRGKIVVLVSHDASQVERLANARLHLARTAHSEADSQQGNR